MNINEAFAVPPVAPPHHETSNEIVLTESEMLTAALIGARRQLGALLAGRVPGAGFTGLGWDVHVEGAAGELAFARFRNLYWSGSVGTYRRGGDVGPIQVRTRSRADYDLIVRNTDRSEDIFVLVIGTIPRFEIIGWIRGGDAKQPQYLKRHGDRPAAYFVPRSALRPFEAR